MALVDIVAHRITRSSPGSACEVRICQESWTKNGRIEECFRELKHGVLKRSGKQYGRFSEDRAAFPLASWLDEYLDEKMTFQSMSSQAMKHLKAEMDKEELVQDGFLIFAFERLEDADLLHVFYVQHAVGHYIDGDLQMSEVLYLDTSGVQLAAKINIGYWKSDDPEKTANCLSILRWRGEKEFTQVFENFIGFAEKLDINAETEQFLSIVTEYTSHFPKDVADQAKADVVEFCIEQEKAGKPVVMSDLSGRISPKELPANVDEKDLPAMEFSSYLDQKEPKAKRELIPDKSQLRNFVRISGRNEAMSMSFDTRCLGGDVVYEEHNDRLVIQSIPASLKSKLMKHLNVSDRIDEKEES